MTDKPPPSEVHIDRLVLDIPGLDPAQLRAVAESIAQRLSTAGAAGTRDHLVIDIPAHTGDLARGIVAALMQRLA